MAPCSCASVTIGSQYFGVCTTHRMEGNFSAARYQDVTSLVAINKFPYDFFGRILPFYFKITYRLPSKIGFTAMVSRPSAPSVVRQPMRCKSLTPCPSQFVPSPEAGVDSYFKPSADYGFCSAKKMHYHGCKLGLRISRKRHDYPLSARPHDTNSLSQSD